MQFILWTRSHLHALQAEHSFSFWDLEAFFDCPRPRLLTIGAQTVHRSDPQMSSLRVSVCACMNMYVYVYVHVCYICVLPTCRIWCHRLWAFLIRTALASERGECVSHTHAGITHVYKYAHRHYAHTFVTYICASCKYNVCMHVCNCNIQNIMYLHTHITQMQHVHA